MQWLASPNSDDATSLQYSKQTVQLMHIPGHGGGFPGGTLTRNLPLEATMSAWHGKESSLFHMLIEKHILSSAKAAINVSRVYNCSAEKKTNSDNRLILTTFALHPLF